MDRLRRKQSSSDEEEIESDEGCDDGEDGGGGAMSLLRGMDSSPDEEVEAMGAATRARTGVVTRWRCSAAWNPRPRAAASEQVMRDPRWPRRV